MVIDCDVTGICSIFIPKLREALQAILSSGRDLKAIVLFGSVATGKFGIHSDIDLLVILKDGTGLLEALSEAEELEERLSQNAPPVQIQVTTIQSWLDYSRDTFFKDEVGREGLVLWKAEGGQDAELKLE